MNITSRYSIRPSRVIFYINTSQEDIDNFYRGIVSEKLTKYGGAFGTYGDIGLFIINRSETKLKVIGIEYRPNDSRISYPEDLESIELPYSYFRTDVIIEDFENEINDCSASEYIKTALGEKLPYRPYIEGKVALQSDPEAIQIYITNNQVRLLLSADYVPNQIGTYDDDDTSIYKEMYYHDGTTGHYNWNFMWPRISGYCAYGIQDFSLVYFDVKDLNAINVIYGHIVGSEFLKNIATELKKLDWVYFSARCDNDNFAMMIKDMPQEETTKKLEDFFESVSHFEKTKKHKVYYRCGVVTMRNTVDMGNLAVDAAKQAHSFGTKPFKTEIIYFTDEMRAEQERSIRLITYLDTAIENDEFLIYLQPKYDINTEKIKGAEALIRWMYKGKKLLSPASFIPLFEAGGLISKLDDIVLKKVCCKIKEWEHLGKKTYPISVNISRKSAEIPDIASHLTDIVDSYGVDHGLIDFELTETIAYDNQHNIINIISTLKNSGFRTSVDDFGTGYSSLSLLPIMPFDTLKIDKSFVDGVGLSKDNVKNCVVVKQIIAMAKELEMVCLAEGAEEKEQVDILRKFGCEVVQGYYYSKPIPVEEFEKFLE